MSGRERVLVVGAGLIGLFAAHALDQAGYRVTVIERGSSGSGAARGNGGWVCPSRSDPMPSPSMLREGAASLVNPNSSLTIRPNQLIPLAKYLTRFALNANARKYARGWADLDLLNRHTQRLFDALAEEGIATGLNEHGFLPVFEDRASAVAAHAATEATAARGLTPRPAPLLERAALLRREPALGPAANYGFLDPGDRWLDPNTLVDHLISALGDRGVEILEGESVQGVFEEHSRVDVITQHGIHSADRVVIATGGWANELLTGLGLTSMVVPAKGYSFSVFPDVMPLHNIQCGASHVGATPMPGRLRMVGTVEFDGTYDTLNRNRITMMKRGAAPFLSGIDWDNVADEWVGPRPMTPDGLPLIGMVPGHDRIVVATGHNMLGLSQGPSTAKLVVELLREPGKLRGTNPFDPARFTSARTLRRQEQAIAR